MKRARERSRRERGAIDPAARRAGEGALFQTCFLVQGCQISREVRLGMTELPNLTGGGGGGGRPDLADAVCLI